MSWLRLELAGGRTAYTPGDEMAGTASWHMDGLTESVVLRLFWYTEGKGDRDVGVAEELRFDPPSPEDRRELRFTLPEGPYSFSGKLISLIWALELVVEPGEHTERQEIVLSPTGEEVRLQPAETPG